MVGWAFGCGWSGGTQADPGCEESLGGWGERAREGGHHAGRFEGKDASHRVRKKTSRKSCRETAGIFFPLVLQLINTKSMLQRVEGRSYAFPKLTAQR